jgi:hypothetical protein
VSGVKRVNIRTVRPGTGDATRAVATAAEFGPEDPGSDVGSAVAEQAAD